MSREESVCGTVHTWDYASGSIRICAQETAYVKRSVLRSSGGHIDGLFYVKEPEWPSIIEDETGKKDYPIYQMGEGMAHVPDRLVNATIEAAEDCPGECIFIGIDE